MINVREGIEHALWVSGSGCSYTETIENRVLQFDSIEDIKNVTMEDFQEYFEGQVSKDGEEDEITVTYTKCDFQDNPMFTGEDIIAVLKFTLNQLNQSHI